MHKHLIFLILAGNLFAGGLSDMDLKQPEKFNWSAYVDSGDSTSDEMVRAEKGVSILKTRIDGISEEYLALLKKRGQSEDLKLFVEMQAQWAKAVDAEVSFIGYGWKGGSGARAIYPKARMECYLRRVSELLELKARAISLNE